jgi:penicillin-binding protein 2
MVWQQGNRLSYEDFLEKFRIVVLFFAALFVVLSLRLFYLQVIKGDYFTNLSDQQHTSIVIERAPRGEIFGSKGEVIVKNKSSFVVLYYPFSQNKISGLEIANKLEQILNKEITAKIGNGHKVVKLIEKLSRNELFKVQEKRLSIPSIAVLEETSRDRAYPEAMSHLTGYLGDVSPEELENIEDEGYKVGDLMGRGGLEQQYDLDLRGQDGGWRIEVDALGHQTKMFQYIPSVKGNSLYTTIDTELQKTACEALKKSSSGKGAVVIIDPRNGAVRALVSVPGFNPDFSNSRDFSRYLRNENLPLFNRALQAVYPPGSVF